VRVATAADCFVRMRYIRDSSRDPRGHSSMEKAMHVDGRCHCGKITYEAELDPERVSICHCTDCQNLSGSAYRVSVPAARDQFRMLTGTPKIYIKTAESGNKRAHVFCQDCGTPIYSSPVTEDFPAYSLRVGPIRQRAQLRPKVECFRRSALIWLGVSPECVTLLCWRLASAAFDRERLTTGTP